MRTIIVILGYLLTSTPVLAATFRVGPGGTHATIQAALDDAAGREENVEIRVAAGTYHERLRVGPVEKGRELLLLGGWDSGFARREIDPTRTTIDGGGVAPVVTVPNLDTGMLTIVSFTITGGHQPPSGAAAAGGVHARLAGDGVMALSRLLVRENRLEYKEGVTGGAVQLFIEGGAKAYLENSVIRDNHTRAPGATAGGLSVHVYGTGHFDMDGNHLTDNAAIATTDVASSGGADIFAGDDARVWVTDNTFYGNAATGVTEAVNAALGLVVQGSVLATVRDNTFMGNRTTAASGHSHSAVSLHAQRQEGSKGRARIDVLRNWFRHNTANNEGSPQAWVNAHAADIYFHDSAIVTGSGVGLEASADKPGRTYLTNLTVSRNDGAGIRARGEGSVFVSNSIVFGNGSDELPASVTATTNLHADPLFLDSPADFHLRPGSQAIDAGTNEPPGGLGTNDLDDLLRIQNDRVDIGAHESRPGGKPPRLGRGCSLRLSGPYGAYQLADTNACTCVTNDVLRAFRCGFLTGDFLLDLNLPALWKEGDAVEATWSLQPWRSELDPTFQISAAALIDGKWVPQKPGKNKGKLELDQLTKATLPLRLPATGSTVVRTSIAYQRKGQAEPTQLQIDLVMPDPAVLPPGKKGP
jgi:hypothetical protein